MNIYTCTDFHGHHPVGVAAVVRAPDEATARAILDKALALEGLRQKTPYTLQEFAPTHNVRILTDGNY